MSEKKLKKRVKKAVQRKKRSKLVKIGKGLSLKRGQEERLSKKPGSSNIGEYKTVKKSDFAGPSGGSAPGTYPINTKKRARAALAYARNAPNPAGIKKAVYKRYSSLSPLKEKK